MKTSENQRCLTMQGMQKWNIGQKRLMKCSRCQSSGHHHCGFKRHLRLTNGLTLHEKCPNTEVFLSVFSRRQFKYGKIRTRKNSVFGHFLRSLDCGESP